MTRKIYVKPMTWAGNTKFYVGLEPSRPEAAPGHRLGSYFIVCDRVESARAIAESEARRWCATVIECPGYVGYGGLKQ